MRVAVNLAHCAEHYRGGDGINRLHGAAHAEWLARAVTVYRGLMARELESWYQTDLFVAVTGWPGWPDVEVSPGNPERDWYWQALGRSRFVTMNHNPGHQQGAAWCIRLGLEAAGKLGYDFLVHAAEDVLPFAGTLPRLAQLLAEGYDYAGQSWNSEELSSQFFACRVPWLAGLFDPGQVGPGNHIERYLGRLHQGRAVCRLPEHSLYRHTHDWDEYRRWLAEGSLLGESPSSRQGGEG
jgi:hypothetical protein